MSVTNGKPSLGTEVVLRGILAVTSLSREECEFIRGLPGIRETRPRGATLMTEDEKRRRMRFVVSGWACRQRLLPDGRRQIFGFALPGDLLDLNMSPLAPAPVSIVALTPIVLFDFLTLREAATNGLLPGLGRLDLLAASLELVRTRDQVLRLGRQTAYERIAHLLLELHHRLRAMGLTSGAACPLPLTQETLADALGLSLVHVNRTLKQLRVENLVALRAGQLRLLNVDALAEIADFRLMVAGGTEAGGGVAA
jgi:CRP-like cAMP-binding protein